MPDRSCDKRKVIVDPFPRTIHEIFSPGDLQRLNDAVEVIWGKNDSMPAAEVDRMRQDVFAIVTGRWRHGAVGDLPGLRAILEVGGRHPSPKDLDYAACFARGIRVLSCAPAFGPMVAEMALGLALASARDIVEAHNAFRAGQERYLHAGNVDTFTLYEQTVGFIGFGGLAGVESAAHSLPVHNSSL